MTKDIDIIVYQGNLPAQVSRRVEVEYARQIEHIIAIGEVGMVAMSAVSEVERHAAFKVATTAAAAELLTRGAVATRQVSPAEQETQQKLFENYTQRMAQLAEISGIKIIQSVDRATNELSKRTFADALEDFDARIADAVLGRPNRQALPNGSR
jgi:hypothetical protein